MRLLSFAVLLPLAGCMSALPPSDGGLALEDGGPMPDAAVATDAPVLADAPVTPDAPLPADAGECPTRGDTPSAELIALHETLIRPGCVGAGRFCHEGGYEGFGMLTVDMTLTNLVDVTGCADVRVTPCRPEESYVLEVMRTGGEPCGRAFPPISGGVHPTFSASEIAAVETWIRNGAR